MAREKQKPLKIKTALRPYRDRPSTPQQVVPIGTELHHVSMQPAHGVRGGTAITNIRCAPLAGNGSLRRSTSIFEAQSPSFSPHHPSPGPAANRSLGRDDDLRNGAPRRVPASIQPDAALRGVGLGRSGSVDRAAQASSSRQCLETGCPSTKNSPCSGGFERGMRPGSSSQPTKASSSLDAERGKRLPSFATLTRKATRATSSTSLVSA